MQTALAIAVTAIDTAGAATGTGAGHALSVAGAAGIATGHTQVADAAGSAFAGVPETAGFTATTADDATGGVATPRFAIATGGGGAAVGGHGGRVRG